MTYKAAIAPACSGKKLEIPQTCQFVPGEPKGNVFISASYNSVTVCYITSSFGIVENKEFL